MTQTQKQLNNLYKNITILRDQFKIWNDQLKFMNMKSHIYSTFYSSYNILIICSDKTYISEIANGENLYELIYITKRFSDFRFEECMNIVKRRLKDTIKITEITKFYEQIKSCLAIVETSLVKLNIQ